MYVTIAMLAMIAIAVVNQCVVAELYVSPKTHLRPGFSETKLAALLERIHFGKHLPSAPLEYIERGHLEIGTLQKLWIRSGPPVMVKYTDQAWRGKQINTCDICI